MVHRRLPELHDPNSLCKNPWLNSSISGQSLVSGSARFALQDLTRVESLEQNASKRGRMRLPYLFTVTAPETIEDLFDEANGDVALGELDAAAEKFQQCVAACPDFFDGWQSLALALGKLNRLDEAIAAGLKAVELDPNDSLIWTALSQLYVKNGQIQPAEDAKAKARIISWGGKVDRMRL